MSKKGVDISLWQSDLTDMSLLKNAGYDFAIIRISEGQSTDTAFEQHYRNAGKAEIARGVYVYSHANSEAKARAEANYLLNILNGRKLELPIFIDLESDDINFAWNHKITSWVLAFGETIKAAGYRWGTYATKSWYVHKLDIPALRDAGAIIWVSDYNGRGHDIDHDIWQYDNKGRVNGYNSKLDMNLLYDDNLISGGKGTTITQPDKEETGKMTKTEAIAKLVAHAKAEIGYKEKKSNSQLDDTTANAGSGNWTKYARDIDNKYPKFYNGKKNGYAWCDIFVDWNFIDCFGYENALAMLYQPEHSSGAGCSNSANYYRRNGAFYPSPEVGDQIFFGDYGNEGHTGIVVAVNGRIVTTVEGNTSGGGGVDGNGDGVYQKTYDLNSTYIPGFGRPNWGVLGLTNGTITPSKHPELSMGMSGNDVRKAQQLLIAKGYSCGSWGADGDFGNGTYNAVISIQKDCGFKQTGIIDSAVWAILLDEPLPGDGEESEEKPTPEPTPTLKKGIDVSRWQGDIAWDKVKASGVEFAIIKAGGSDSGFYTDIKFEQNYAGAKAAGVPVGAYYFVGPKCTSYEDGAADAQRFLEILEGKQFEYPVYIDLESTDRAAKAGATQACIGFVDVMEAAGYYCGIYASDISGFCERLDITKLDGIDKWVARYGSKPTYVKEYGMWQNSNTGEVNGISGDVDMNEAYKDYPTLMKTKGLNGFAAMEPPKDESDEISALQAENVELKDKFTRIKAIIEE